MTSWKSWDRRSSEWNRRASNRVFESHWRRRRAVATLVYREAAIVTTSMGSRTRSPEIGDACAWSEVGEMEMEMRGELGQFSYHHACLRHLFISPHIATAPYNI